MLLALAGPLHAQPAPLAVLDVPFIAQSESLCGGAAAAMVLRYWGERELTAESFAHLVDRSAAGIRTHRLVAELRQRGWAAEGIAARDVTLAQELAAGRPVIALIEDRPGTFHYVVVIAITGRAVVFHDPARAPYRVSSTAEFDRRWQAADRWMAVIAPRADRAPREPAAAEPAGAATPTSSLARVPASCEELVAAGVREAQAGKLDAAERSLAAAVACPGTAALRELAGVRVLQRRWPDAADLAATVVAAAPEDEYAWRVLATSRFLQNDRLGALEAWNHVGEPRLDLLRVNGLTHTRQRVVERLVAVPTGSVLVPRMLNRAERRLGELPSAISTRLDYVPVPGGLAELRANVFERPRLPSSALDLAGLGAVTAARREIAVPIVSASGGGEEVLARWRFWSGRPLYGAAITAPARWGGIWGVDASYSEQPFDAAIPAARRTSATVSVSDWATAGLRWTVRGGVDRWDGRSAFGRAGMGVRIASSDDRFELRGDGDTWVAGDPFAIVSAVAAARTSRRREGLVLTGRGGFGAATSSTPPDLWFVGDTGHVSTILLRAHDALDEGRLRTSQLGRTAIHGSFETQYWWRAPWSTAIAAAAFADAARLSRRLEDGSRDDSDVGVGLRLAIPGLSGLLRIDGAYGFRDGARALSFAYEPW